MFEAEEVAGCCAGQEPGCGIGRMRGKSRSAGVQRCHRLSPVSPVVTGCFGLWADCVG